MGRGESSGFRGRGGDRGRGGFRGGRGGRGGFGGGRGNNLKHINIDINRLLIRTT